MIDGGETIVTKARDEENVLPSVGPTATEPPPVKKKAKVGKANLKGKENLLALPWETAAPNPAATVGKLDVSTENVANACGMKNRANRKRNPHTTITPNMQLTSRQMRSP
jgi:hypothetical protein